MQQNVHKDSLDLMDIDPELNLYSIENVYPIYVLLPRTALDATAPRDLGPSQIHFAPENSAWSQRASMLDIGRLRHSSYGCDPKTL